MSTTREPKIPGPDHPIDVKPFAGRVRVTAGGHTLADSEAALALHEASYPPVYYVPLADVDQGSLRPSETTTYCPYKGDASYYDVIAPDTQQAIADAVWHYRDPYPSVAEIAEYVAFYPDRVELDVQPE
ncbi:MAG: DUF427 domain-containing protein [Conexibacteraceae bacterium]|nr:DUF427 domain-containing protein [Conexibacteraceae bacterium]